MTYPQPSADAYAVGGYDFFRLNTVLTSDGDMYESQQGGLGFAIGPDSDISKVNIGYFDDEIQNFLNQVAISPARPFVGLLGAHNDSDYAPSNRPGRVLMWPDELFNSSFRPGAFDNPSRLDIISPVLDVVQYFSPVVPQPARNNKTYQFQRLPWTTAFYFLLFPFYGRRYAHILFANETNNAATFTLNVYGVTYHLRGATSPGTETLLAGPLVVAPAAQTKAEIVASTAGMYDALYISFAANVGAPAGDTPLRIVVSDSQV